MSAMAEEFQGNGDRVSDRADDDGISPLDLESLPASTRKIMRLILRNVEISNADLRLAVDAFPPAEHIAGDELDKMLDDMVERRWLLRLGGTPEYRYKVNLRRRASRPIGKNLWDKLDGLGSSPKRPQRPDDAGREP